MYGFIWRHLPGPDWARAIQAGILVALVIIALFYIVFPWAESELPFLQVTVDEQDTVSMVTNYR